MTWVSPTCCASRCRVRATPWTWQPTEHAVLKADFSAMATHALGSPLAAIRGFLDMLATGELGPAEEAHALAAMRTEAALLTGLLADVQASATVERDDFAVHPRAA